MKKSRPVKASAKFKWNSARLLRTTLVTLLGVAAAISVAALSLSLSNSSTQVASANSIPASMNQKRYKATRPIVVDRQTGQLRLPNQQEIDKTVESLATLAKRTTDDLQEVSVNPGGVAVDLDSGFAGVMLARPDAGGTWETKCVFTFEEGAEFLGIVEDNLPE